LPKLICICGPTASGKTKVAIALAQHFKTAIISADSRQFYKELHIGTAVPSVEELTQAPHHFIQSHSIHEPLNAGQFAEQGLKQLEHLFAQHEVVVLVGGSGMFVKALTEGLDPLPKADTVFRKRMQQLFLEEGISGLQKLYAQHDPENLRRTELDNPHRIIRSLEIVNGNIEPSVPLKRDFTVQGFVLDWPRDELYDRINQRVDLMMEQGLLREVEALREYQHLGSLQTVGYSELFEYLKGNSSLSEAVDLIKRNTRRYAKRQLTWFRHQTAYTWVERPFLEQILKEV
jgi:tRNA dimethylallyltransferase